VQGTQIARSPVAATIGQNFAFRDYFHGEGKDRRTEDAKDAKPLTEAYVSHVFRSQATNNPMVAFSVPVWSGKLGTANRTVLGVLAMTVEASEFGIVPAELGANQTAILVDTRPDYMDLKENAGRILHHTSMTQASDRNASRDGAPVRLPAEQLQSLIQLRQLRLADRNAKSERSAATGLDFDRQFEDPLATTEESPGLAAFEPIFVRGREQKQADTGWVVIVLERGK